MKETYKVKTPERIKFGDPWYFETCSREDLELLTVDMKLPSYYETKVVLEEQTYEEYRNYKDVAMTIHIVPVQLMKLFLQGRMLASETEIRKKLPVDTAQYNFKVDDKEATIHTGADGVWGVYQEFNRNSGGKTITDAVILTIFFPEEESFDDVRERLKFFFPDAELIENVEPYEEKTEQCEDSSPQQSM